jgi:hypothetical protein
MRHAEWFCWRLFLPPADDDSHAPRPVDLFWGALSTGIEIAEIAAGTVVVPGERISLRRRLVMTGNDPAEKHERNIMPGWARRGQDSVWILLWLIIGSFSCAR